MGGVYHPFIHIGYGLEFSVDPIVAEGLSMAAVTKPTIKPLLFDPPSSSPLTSAMDAAMGTITTLTSTLGLTPSPRTAAKHPSAISIIDAVYSDSSLDGLVRWEEENKIQAMIEKASEKIKEYVKKWIIDAGSKDDVVSKTKELMGIAMALTTGTTRPGKDIKLDFFLMHGLTSSLFLPIYLSSLSSSQAARLLQAFFSTTVGFYISRGRPRIHLADNLSTFKPNLGGYEDEISNPWTTVIKRTIAHEDVHLVKAVRSLIYGATYLAHLDKEYEMKETPGEYKETSQYWLNSAKMTLDALRDGGWWLLEGGVGFDETWDGKSDVGPNQIEHAY